MRYKILLLALFVGWMDSHAAVPTAADLVNYHTTKQACVCVQFLGPVCNDIVWAGSYNDWNTDPNQMAKFQPVAGFTGWYAVGFEDNSQSICGKAVQLTDNGQFNWKYQTGADTSWTIVSGSAQIVKGQNGKESELQNIDKNTPIVAISSSWKNNICPIPTTYSGTLPVLYINTQDRTPITSQEEYLTGTYYLDNLSLAGYTSVGSKESPLGLQIKGRGNYTWTGFQKKPYRLKLDAKAELMGLNKSKHWTLLAHADDEYCWIKNTIGFLLSEQIGLEWTPKQAPVEVVLNGDYIGLYMLTEQIRVDKNRVNIVEQADECTQGDSITGGWLVEIDNYKEPVHVTIYEPQNEWHGEQTIWITPKSPELLSDAQTNYLSDEMGKINTALYDTNDTLLAHILDIDEAARFYLVQELMSDCESYHGSCYLHKDMGFNQLWKFGPVWDFGNSFKDRNQYIYDQPEFSQCWIGQLAGRASFQKSLSKIWKHWKEYDYTQVTAAADSFATLIQDAAIHDSQRWPQYNHSQAAEGKQRFLGYFDKHVQWLVSQWGNGEKDPITQVENILEPTQQPCKLLYHGRWLIQRQGQWYDMTGQRVR